MVLRLWLENAVADGRRREGHRTRRLTVGLNRCWGRGCPGRCTWCGGRRNRRRDLVASCLQLLHHGGQLLCGLRLRPWRWNALRLLCIRLRLLKRRRWCAQRLLDQRLLSRLLSRLL